MRMRMRMWMWTWMWMHLAAIARRFTCGRRVRAGGCEAALLLSWAAAVPGRCFKGGRALTGREAGQPLVPKAA